VTQATGNSEAGQQSRVTGKGSRYDLVLGGRGGGINFGGLVMRFLMTVNGGGRAPDEQMYANMGAVRRGTDPDRVLLATGGLDRGTHVVASGGNITLTDGPFTESKEVIVSFALIEVRSKDEALELARRFWKVVGDGEGDIRQVFGPGD
jgi:hypothetical protein